MALGVPVGLFIGFRGGWVDRIAMRIIDGLSAIPGIVLAISIIAALGTGLVRAMLAVGIVGATILARLTRGQVLAVRERLYIDAARVTGVSQWSLLFRHALPNVAPTLVVQGTLLFATAIIIEAGLSFIGLGVQPPDPSWGVMLSSAQETMERQPFNAVPPGAAIFVTVLSVNIVGDAIQDMMSPRSGVGGRGHLLQRPGRPVAGSGSGTARDGDVLAVRGLTVTYPDDTGTDLAAVDSVDLTIRRGETLALVGESGCGKSSVALAIAGLIAPPGRISAASLALTTTDGETINLGMPGASQLRRARAHHVSMVFQEPAASLNPVRPVGKQIEAVLALGAGFDRSARPARVHELLEQVGITDPSRRARSYPHELSGGMAQRVMIALALAKEPSLLIADEPTTALDVTVQDEILSLLRRLSADLDLAVLLVTHDLGVVADLADRAAVMYAGRIVEEGNVESLLVDPLHPYTSALAAAVPRNQPRSGDLQGLAGSVPLPGEWPDGCTFADRCAYRVDRCDQTEPSLDGIEHAVRCHLAQDLELAGIRAEVGRD